MHMLLEFSSLNTRSGWRVVPENMAFKKFRIIVFFAKKRAHDQSKEKKNAIEAHVAREVVELVY